MAARGPVLAALLAASVHLLAVASVLHAVLTAGGQGEGCPVADLQRRLVGLVICRLGAAWVCAGPLLHVFTCVTQAGGRAIALLPRWRCRLTFALLHPCVCVAVL